MKKLLFFFRLVLFMLPAILPLLHPLTALYMDASSFWYYWILVPSAILLGGIPQSRIQLFNKNISSSQLKIGIALILSLGTIISSGFSVLLPRNLASALILYITTYLIFNKGYGKLLYVEPFYLIWVAYRVSDFSRASSELLEKSQAANTLILVITLTAWLVQACIIYLIEYRAIGKQNGVRGKTLRIAILLLPLLLLVTLFFPAIPSRASDFIQVLNNPDGKLRPRLQEVDGLPDGLKDMYGNGSDGSRDEGEKQGRLYEADGESWRNGPGGMGKDGKQYMVMIVESPYSPVYLADNYLDTLHVREGFIQSPNNWLNELVHAPFMETWRNTEIISDKARRPIPIQIFSTIPDKVSAYLPWMLEPIVRDSEAFPLQYSFRSLSYVSAYSISDRLVPAPSFYYRAPDLRAWLEVPLEPEAKARFQSWIDAFINGDETDAEKVQKILESFSVIQYNLGFTEDVSISALERFLFESREGDCSELANTAAILARLAGIPSRVITGYAVDRGLQSDAHVAALYRLKQVFPPLADKNLSQLYLVSTSHRHAWPQFFLGEAGWVDMEATKYAKAPPPELNPNAMDLVIPDFSTVRPKRNPFPWRLLLRTLFFSTLVVLSSLWLQRLILLLRLRKLARKDTERGIKASFKLFLFRAALRKLPLKKPGQTNKEWASGNEWLSELVQHMENALYHPDPTIRAKALANYKALSQQIYAIKGHPLAPIREWLGISNRGLR